MKKCILNLSVIALVLCGTVLGAGKQNQLFQTVHRADAERFAGTLGYETSAAGWIWTDKYVYQPGEQLTLRTTLRPNNDVYPYTVFAYRVNNQTGAKSFLPGGTANVTDASGRSMDQGYNIAQLQAADKAVALGAGGQLGGAVTIPNELGMHTLVVELRDYTGTRVMKAMYAKIGVVDGFDDLTENISESRTLRNTRGYRLRGVVFVRNNAVLTIEPGTFIIGQPGQAPSPSVLVVSRTGRIAANGTRSRPIIMTSSQPVGQRRRGDWGGLILLGSATANTPAERSFIEGLPEGEDSRYGGTNDDHNCGTLRYVRVEFAGAEFGPNNEVNGITFGGCGRQTVAEYLQVSYGFDDAFEWFGGTSDAKYLVATYFADDGLDSQLGWRGRVQHAVILQNADRGNRGFEVDNSEFNATAEPLGDNSFWNVTVVGSGLAGVDEANSPGIYLRRGAVGTYNNIIVTNFASAGIQIDNPAGAVNIENGRIRMNGILLWNNGRTANSANTLEGQVATGQTLAFANGSQGQGRQFLVADPMLRRPLEFSDPDLRPTPGSPAIRLNWVLPAGDEFYDQSANYLGAFGPDVDWTREWTSFLQESDLR